MPTYARANLVFERGEGAWLISTNGDRYLDFASGVAVNALGHAHPKLIDALTEQANKVWHTSNLYRVAGQERLAERLCEVTFADKVFFCNSGAEACEGAIKLARRYHYVNGRPERWRLITFKGAFHGRTLATIASAGNAKHLEGFGEPAGGFDMVPFGDLEAAENGHRSRDGRHHGRAGAGRGRRATWRPTPGSSRCASCATSTGCCWCSTRCRPAWAAPASCSRTSGRASRPT